MRIAIVDDLISFFRGKGHPFINRRNWVKRHAQQNTIVAVGDSHTIFFSGNDHLKTKKLGYCKGVINTAEEKVEQFSVIHLGPSLAYNTNKYGTTTRTLEKIDYLIKHRVLRPGDRVLCCFGEIDIRAHVMKHVENNSGDYQRVVEGILANYLDFLHYLRSKGLKVCCWGPVAQCRANEGYFSRGTQVERNRAAKCFTEHLSCLADKNHFGVVSLLEELVDKDLATNEAYLLDGVHLNQKAMALLKNKEFFFG